MNHDMQVHLDGGDEVEVESAMRPLHGHPDCFVVELNTGRVEVTWFVPLTEEWLEAWREALRAIAAELPRMERAVKVGRCES